MNKKLLLSLAFLLTGLLAYGHAETRGSPIAASGSPLASANYGGVDVSTSNFSSAFTTATSNDCWVYGVTFSSGNTSDFVQIYATGTYSWSLQGGASTETIRLFNVANSSGGVNNSASYSASGFVPIGPPGTPVHFQDGCGFKANVTNYNSIIMHYWSTGLKGR